MNTTHENQRRLDLDEAVKGLDPRQLSPVPAPFDDDMLLAKVADMEKQRIDRESFDRRMRSYYAGSIRNHIVSAVVGAILVFMAGAIVGGFTMFQLERVPKAGSAPVQQKPMEFEITEQK